MYATVQGPMQQHLGSATVFCVMYRTQPYLVTCWHVLAGRDVWTNECLDRNAATPVSLTVFAHTAHDESAFISVEVPLLDDEGRPMWIEIRDGSRPIDIAALPVVGEVLDAFAGLAMLHPYDLSIDEGYDLFVGDSLAIVGFPLGSGAGQGWPIWAQAFIASEPKIPYMDRNMFLIDAANKKTA